MDEYKREKLLAIFYPLIVGAGFIGSVTTAIAWNHWKYALDTCVEVNCGCILNGRNTITYFIGGHIAYCHLATFGLLFPLFAAVILGTYHVWRVCMSSSPSRTHTVRQRSGDLIIMTSRSEIRPGDSGISPNYWIPACIVSCVMLLFTIAYAGIYLDGFLQSCRQYRSQLIKLMHAAGPMVGAIQGRVSCSAVFDFMDYLHPDPSFERRRIDRIDTPACLIIGLIAAWLSVVSWLVIVIVNIIQARQTRKLRV